MEYSSTSPALYSSVFLYPIDYLDELTVRVALIVTGIQSESSLIVGACEQ